MFDERRMKRLQAERKADFDPKFFGYFCILFAVYLKMPFGIHCQHIVLNRYHAGTLLPDFLHCNIKQSFYHLIFVIEYT